jgi:hypothetical protein
VLGLVVVASLGKLDIARCPESRGKWQVYKKMNEIDGTKTIARHLDAENDIGFEFSPFRRTEELGYRIIAESRFSGALNRYRTFATGFG